WAMRHTLREAEQALAALIDNLPGFLRVSLRVLVFPFGTRLRPPSDRLGDAAAEALLGGAAGAREILTADLHVPAADSPGRGALESAYAQLRDAAEARTKVQQARRDGKLAKDTMANMAAQAHAQGLIDDGELARILASQAAADDVIQVDDFDPAQLREAGVPDSRTLDTVQN